MARGAEIGPFLRARRAEVTPDQVGLKTYGQRRVPGLRREELAMLAGVSVGYYTRIEQGQTSAASPEVLTAIARALQLDPDERDYLLTLAEPPARKVRRYRREEASAAVLGLMNAMRNVASVLAGRRMDVLAWTPLGHALVGSHIPFDLVDDQATRPNWARMIFTDIHLRELFLDWETKCWDVASYLRVQAGNHPQDARLGNLIGELCLSSTVFDDMWASQRVKDESTNDCRIHHPTVGRMDLVNVPLRTPESPDQLLATFYAMPGTPSEAALDLLAQSLPDRGANQASQRRRVDRPARAADLTVTNGS